MKEKEIIIAKDAHVNCWEYLQKKLPFSSLLLKCVSSINTIAREHGITLQRLQRAPSLIANVLTDWDKKTYSLEEHQYQMDLNLQSPVDDSGNLVHLDI